jgi:endonuclease/exonuclease/phosphatase (EEP) superfamily protein YafD
LFELVKRSPKPVIVAGDFNTFWGEHEMALFMEATGLRSANRHGIPSYPARRPRIELDFILYSRGIEIEAFEVPNVTFSDHRPLICDFRLNGAQRVAA